MTPTVVLFDAGNTLVHLDFPALQAIFAEAGARRTADQIRDAAELTRAELNRFLAAREGSTESRDTRGYLLRLVYDRLEVPEDDRRTRITAALARSLSGLWRVPDPDAVPTLTALRAGGRRLGVVSNSDGTIAAGLERVGLAGFFETVVDSGAEGVEKPDPAIFRIALRRMGAAPEEAVYVGDIPAVDLAGARAAGITPVLIDPRDLFPGESAPRIRSLSELPGVLDRLHP
jgi:putative hydrolase of the HAD superfamily